MNKMSLGKSSLYQKRLAEVINHSLVLKVLSEGENYGDEIARRTALVSSTVGKILTVCRNHGLVIMA